MSRCSKARLSVEIGIAFLAGFATTLVFIVLFPGKWSSLSPSQYEPSFQPPHSVELFSGSDFKARSTKAISIATRAILSRNPETSEYWQTEMDNGGVSVAVHYHGNDEWRVKFIRELGHTPVPLLVIVLPSGRTEIIPYH